MKQSDIEVFRKKIKQQGVLSADDGHALLDTIQDLREYAEHLLEEAEIPVVIEEDYTLCEWYGNQTNR